MSDRTGNTRDTESSGRSPDRGAGRGPGSSSDSGPDLESRDIESFEREADEYDAAAQAGHDDDLDLEAPEADAAEQRAELLQQRDEPITARPTDRDGEADPADTAEQRRVVVEDEEDYR